MRKYWDCFGAVLPGLAFSWLQRNNQHCDKYHNV